MADLLPAQLQQLTHCAAEARDVLKQVQCCGGSLLAPQAPDIDYIFLLLLLLLLLLLFCLFVCFLVFSFPCGAFIQITRIRPSLQCIHSLTHSQENEAGTITILRTRRPNIIILPRCPLLQTARQKCGQQQSSYITHQTLRQQGGTGEDSHIHLADWTLSVAAIEKKKKTHSHDLFMFVS